MKKRKILPKYLKIEFSTWKSQRDFHFFLFIVIITSVYIYSSYISKGIITNVFYSSGN